MRIHHLFCASALTILAAFSSAAQTNLPANGSFEFWNADKPESWNSARGENGTLSRISGRMTTIPGILFFVIRRTMRD